MVKRCQWGHCKSDSRYPDRLEGGIVFIPFPKPKRSLDKCRRWIKMCGRSQEQLNIEKINGNYHMFVCSKHFPEGFPTERFPDPIPFDQPTKYIPIRPKPKTQTATEQPIKRTQILKKTDENEGIFEDDRMTKEISTQNSSPKISAIIRETTVPVVVPSASHKSRVPEIPTTMGVDLDILREIPGYKVIMKAVLKNQIKALMEQLSSDTDEESIFLTASISDGTLSHLGSNSGKGFIDENEELKSQFLNFCLNVRHSHKPPEMRKNSNDISSNKSPSSAGPVKSKRRKATALKMEPYPITKPTRTETSSFVDFETDGPIIKIEPVETDYGDGSQGVQEKDLENVHRDYSDNVHRDYSENVHRDYLENVHKETGYYSENVHRETEYYLENVHRETRNYSGNLDGPSESKPYDKYGDLSEHVQKSKTRNVTNESVPSMSMGTEEEGDNTDPMKMEEVSSDKDIELDIIRFGQSSFSGADMSLDVFGTSGSSADNLGTDKNSMLLTGEEVFIQGAGVKRLKRRHSHKTFQTKYEALVALETGVKSRADIRRELDIPESTLSTWVKNKETIKECFHSYAPDRFKVRNSTHKVIEDETINWYRMLRSKDQQVTGPMLQRMAQKIGIQYGIEDFKASCGWLSRFRKRHNITCSPRASKNVND